MRFEHRGVPLWVTVIIVVMFTALIVLLLQIALHLRTQSGLAAPTAEQIARQAAGQAAEAEGVARATTTPGYPGGVLVTWGETFNAGPYTISIDKPVDRTQDYPCDGCEYAIFVTTVTIKANVPIELSAVAGMFVGRDVNYGPVRMTSLGDGTLPAGQTRTVRGVQLQMAEGRYAPSGFSLSLHNDAAVDIAHWDLP